MSSFNASRLTCFALLSALETDSRDVVLTLDEGGVDSDWPQEAEANARLRFQREHGDSAPDRTDLVVFLDFPDAGQILMKNKVRARQLLDSETVDLIGRSIDGVTAIRNRVAHNRPMSVEDLPTLIDLCEMLNRADVLRWPTVGATLHKLKTDPSHVLGLTIRLRADPVDVPFHNLPVPDFDETGFVGRSAAVRQITRAVLGPWPAVSILGDGGIGKTSIALKVAYDILDDHRDEFDAVVWVTAKSSTLSSHEVQRINGAIMDSVGLFAEAARRLGAPGNAADPMAELLEYLSSFRVLLILDNMETVMDQRLRDFLRELPRGSKVLITSRIGFQMENPIKLDPLTDGESRQLLMALSHRRNVSVLRNLDETGVSKLISKTSGHPLFIKWLVASVQAGRRPSEVVNNNETLLDFCMSDVFDKLTEASVQVLQSMQVIRGSRMQAELAFLNGMTAHEIQSALLELLTTNFVVMTQSASDQLENSYVVGDFASAYLARKRPTPGALRTRVLDRAARLVELNSAMSGERRLSPFDPWTLDVRGAQDVPVAKILRDSHRAIQSGKVDLALELCNEAQGLSPAYHEAWRVEALAHMRRGDLGSAEQAFERAMELADDTTSSAIVGYHFAVFLSDEVSQHERALGILQAAAATNTSVEILIEIARCHFLLMSYAAALDVCKGSVAKPMTASQADDLTLLALRASSFGLIRDLYHGTLGRAVELVEQLTDFVYQLAVERFDNGLEDWLVASTHWASVVSGQVHGEQYLSRRTDEYLSKLKERLRVIDAGLLDRKVAAVRAPLPEGGYAFLDDGRDTFMHRNALLSRASWSQITPGSIVAYDHEVGDRGYRAIKVRLLD